MNKFITPAKAKTHKLVQSIAKDLAKPKRDVMPSKSLQAEANNLAIKQGWTALSPREKMLIDVLRYTSYHGRNVVIDVAMTMRKSHPWVDGSAENTNTTYPDSKWFFQRLGA